MEQTSENIKVTSVPNTGGRAARNDFSMNMPGVLFTMRYPDNAGYVWNTIALGRDKAGFNLATKAACFIAYPKLTGEATYKPAHLESVELDCYDMSANAQELVKNFVLKNRIKVIVFMSALPSTVDLRFLRKLGVRTINTENDSFDHRKRDSYLLRTSKFIVRSVLKKQLHDLHLANAKSQHTFLSKYAFIPASRLALLTNGIDCEKFRPGDKSTARDITGLDQNKFWIICVSQTRREKRLDFIIRVAKAVVSARPDRDIGFVYVGSGDESLIVDLKNLVDELDLKRTFRFAGAQNDLVPYYRSANLMVHAAERESFGLAIVEAMACGLPVIASAAAGPTETILNGKVGAVVEIDDFSGFVEKILAYIDNEELTSRHGAQAREHVKSTYSIERYGRDLAKHIEAFL